MYTAIGSGLLVTLGMKRVATLGTLHVLSHHLLLANGTWRQLSHPKPVSLPWPKGFRFKNLVLVPYATPVHCHTKVVLPFPVLDSVLAVVEGAVYGIHMFLAHGAAAVILVLRSL